jgi:membrane associated rhomboid family serine protease
MIPLRDTTPTRNVPVVNLSLIGLNVLVYLLQMTQGADIDRFVFIYGLVPARYSVPELSTYFSLGDQIFSLFSFMFLHGGFMHLLGNMWSLYIFGDNVEDLLGPFRYLAFYLLCGLCSGFAHLAFNFTSSVPTIGASGAIAGVMGAYFLLYPNSRILTLIPIIIIPWFIELPAFVFLAIWFILQFLNATFSQPGAAGIAWWAHIGGFLFGMLFLKLFQKIPAMGVTGRMRPIMRKRHTDRLQVIRPVGPGDDDHLQGLIQVTPHEAAVGTRKLVNIPWGFHHRMIRVMVPAGVKEGTRLRLKGLGKIAGQDRQGRTARGDLFLKVKIRGY